MLGSVLQAMYRIKLAKYLSDLYLLHAAKLNTLRKKITTNRNKARNQRRDLTNPATTAGGWVHSRTELNDQVVRLQLAIDVSRHAQARRYLVAPDMCLALGQASGVAASVAGAGGGATAGVFWLRGAALHPGQAVAARKHLVPLLV